MFKKRNTIMHIISKILKMYARDTRRFYTALLLFAIVFLLSPWAQPAQAPS